jgi:hypothetical protein
MTQPWRTPPPIGAAASSGHQERSAAFLRAAELSAIGAVFVLGLHVASMTSSWGLILNTPVFHYIAARIADGQLPYRDIYEFNMPLVHWIHYFVIRVIGGGDTAWRIFDFAVLAMFAGLCGGLLARVDRAAGALLAGFIALLHFYSGPILVGERDFMILVPLAGFAALYHGALYGDSGRLRLRLCLAGALLGIAVLIKPTPVIAIPMFAAHLLARGSFSRASRIDAAAFCAGPAAIGLAALLFLAATGALRDFLIIQFELVLKIYAQSPGFSNWPYAWDILPIVLPIALVSPAIAVATPEVKRVATIFGLLAAFGVIHLWVQGKFYDCHFYPAAMFIMAVGATGYAGLRKSRRPELRRAASLVGIVVAMAGIQSFALARPEFLRPASWDGNPYVHALSSDLNTLGAEGRVVQPMDIAAGALHSMYVAGVRAPTRYIYGIPFFSAISSPHVAAIRADLIAQMRAAGNPPLVLSQQQWDTGAYAEHLARWPEFAQWLASDYRIFVERDLGEGGGYRIYVRKEYW